MISDFGVSAFHARETTRHEPPISSLRWLGTPRELNEAFAQELTKHHRINQMGGIQALGLNMAMNV